MRNFAYILVAALLTPLGVFSQQNPISGQNVVQHRQLEWKNVSTEHFIIHYYNADPSLAMNVARYAEEGLWDVCKMLDYKNKTQFSFYLFLSPADYLQSNLVPERVIRDAGISPVRNNTASLVFPGTMREMQQEVKTNVTRMVIEDYYFGGGLQKTIRNTVLLHLPDWYIDGITHFIGEGWTYEDEMWLHGLENEVLHRYALDGDEPMNVFARKSIWYFIAANYGVDKLSEIFYMTRLTRDVEDGIIHVLGITLKTLTERWREFVIQRINTNKTFRNDITDAGKQVEISNGDRLLGYSLNPKERDLAMLLENQGKQRLVIRDLDNDLDFETPIKGGDRTDRSEKMRLELPVAFSPDGKWVATIVYQSGEEVLAFYNTETEEETYTPYRRQLDRIVDISWSHDSKQLVCSGLAGGFMNLYRFGIGAGGFVALTDDPFENVHPVWSLDDQRIYFASTRPNDTISNEEYRFDDYRNSYDLWELSLEDNSLRRVTETPLADEYPVDAVSSFEIMIRTNYNGIFNLQTRNVFVGDSTFHTNFSQGVYSADHTDQDLAYLFPHQGELALYTAKQSEVISDDYVVNTLLKNVTLKELRRRKEAEMRKARLDSLNKIKVDLPVQGDTAKAKEPEEKKVKYYIFDEDEESVQQERKRLRRKRRPIERRVPVKPDFQELKINTPKRSKNQWGASQVITSLGYDPVFRLSLLFDVELQDQQGNHGLKFGFRPFWDLRSSDTYFRYTNKKHKLDYSVGIERSSRYLVRSGFSSRFNATKLRGSAVLPLSRYTSVSGGLQTSYVNRFNVELIIPKEIDDSDFFAGANLNLTYDKRDWRENFVTNGTYASFDIFNVYSAGNSRNEFLTASFDFRKYIPLRKVVLATRVTGGWSTGAAPQRFFLGGTDQWLFSQFFNLSDFPFQNANLSDFHFMEYITPSRGFQFNSRNGSKYVLANAELRMPLGRMFRSALNSNPIYNIEFIPFFDFGTAWEEGNPLSQRNPIDTETINAYPLSVTVQTLKSPFVMGFGAGLRTKILGYNIRADLGWGVEDYTILRPRVHVSLGKNF